MARFLLLITLVLAINAHYTTFFSEGLDGGDINIGRDATDALFRAEGAFTRYCAWCEPSHVQLYYVRERPLPPDWSLYDTVLHTWHSRNNTLNVDFYLYDNIVDMCAGTNRWQYCNYDANDIGFPRDCAKYQNASLVAPVTMQWFSLTVCNDLTLKTEWAIFNADSVCATPSSTPTRSETSSVMPTQSVMHYVSPSVTTSEATSATLSTSASPTATASMSSATASATPSTTPAVAASLSPSPFAYVSNGRRPFINASSTVCCDSEPTCFLRIGPHETSVFPPWGWSGFAVLVFAPDWSIASATTYHAFWMDELPYFKGNLTSLANGTTVVILTCDASASGHDENVPTAVEAMTAMGATGFLSWYMVPAARLSYIGLLVKGSRALHEVSAEGHGASCSLTVPAV